MNVKATAAFVNFFVSFCLSPFLTWPLGSPFQIQKHLTRRTVPNNLVYVGELLSGGKTFKPKMDELVRGGGSESIKVMKGSVENIVRY